MYCMMYVCTVSCMHVRIIHACMIILQDTMESEPEVADVIKEDVIDEIQTNDDDYGDGENNDISIESVHIGRVMCAYFCVMHPKCHPPCCIVHCRYKMLANTL